MVDHLKNGYLQNIVFIVFHWWIHQNQTDIDVHQSHYRNALWIIILQIMIFFNDRKKRCRWNESIFDDKFVAYWLCTEINRLESKNDRKIWQSNGMKPLGAKCDYNVLQVEID